MNEVREFVRRSRMRVGEEHQHGRRGQLGIFEWIVEVGGNVTHRVFIPGGKVTGIPNIWP
jgi:hypothetical protein